jgi:hypothetical protein
MEDGPYCGRIAEILQRPFARDYLPLAFELVMECVEIAEEK